MVLSELGTRHKYAPDVIVATWLLITLLVTVRCSIGSSIHVASIASGVAGDEVLVSASTLLLLILTSLPRSVLYLLLHSWIRRLILSLL